MNRFGALFSLAVIFVGVGYCETEPPKEVQALAEKGYELWKQGKIVNGNYTDPIPEQQGYEFQYQGDKVAVFHGRPGWFQWIFKIQGDNLIFDKNLADLYPPKNPQSSPISISISSYSLCTRVENREPVEIISSKSTAANKVYFWTAVDSEIIPSTIDHVWIYNDKEIARLKLTIGYPKTRTWSSKNLMPGEWEVKAMTEAGDVLAETHFTNGQ